MSRTIPHAWMTQDNNRKNIGNNTYRLKKKIMEKKLIFLCFLPNTQNINVSHPPTIYLIETVFESIRFVSAEQLSDINRHGYSYSFIEKKFFSKKNKQICTAKYMKTSVYIYHSTELIRHVVILVIIPSSSSSSYLYLNKIKERDNEYYLILKLTSLCRNRSILKKKKKKKER
jgi:hypothetical protein